MNKITTISKILTNLRNYASGYLTKQQLESENITVLFSKFKNHQIEAPKFKFKKVSQKKPPVDGDIIRLDLSKRINTPLDKQSQDMIYNRNTITPTHPLEGAAFWNSLKNEN